MIEAQYVHNRVQYVYEYMVHQTICTYVLFKCKFYKYTVVYTCVRAPVCVFKHHIHPAYYMHNDFNLRCFFFHVLNPPPSIDDSSINFHISSVHTLSFAFPPLRASMYFCHFFSMSTRFFSLRRRRLHLILF